MGKRPSVDAQTLCRTFKIFSATINGLQQYIRDDADTYSPMMSRLRQDKCRDPRVIDAFLGCQRYLTLQGVENIFDYTHRILFVAQLIESDGKAGLDLRQNVWLGDPATNYATAAMWRVLASDKYDWYVGLDDPIMNKQRDLDIIESASVMLRDIPNIDDLLIQIVGDGFERVRPEEIERIEKEHKRTLH